MADTPIDPELSSLFVSWTDPESGVKSYILDDDSAPWQKAFYFTNNNVTDDGRYMWFEAFYPPSTESVLGVVDTRTDEVRVYPETAWDSHAHVDTKDGSIFWTHRRNVFTRGPAADVAHSHVGHVPREVIGGRQIDSICTHITPSADGNRINLDIIARDDSWYTGAMDIETGDVEIWTSWDRFYHHSQFHPTDPELLMVSQEIRWDPVTGNVDHESGEGQPVYNRIWLLRKGEEPVPLFDPQPGRVTHEVWSTDGSKIWFVDHDKGAGYVDIESGEHEFVWPTTTFTVQASADDDFLVGDYNALSPDQPVGLTFYDRETDVEVDIVSAMPSLDDITSMPAPVLDIHRSQPNAQFILDDEFIVYTTNVRGDVELALTHVSDLLEHTR